MNEIKKLRDVVKKFDFILSVKQKKYMAVLMIMSIIGALLELLGVSIIIPMLDLLLNTETLRNKWYVKPFINLFNIDSNGVIVVLVCLMIISIYIIKNVYFIFYNWLSLKYSLRVQKELSSRIFLAYMRQGYIFFVKNNSAKLLLGMGTDIASLYNILSVAFGMLTKLLTIVCIGVFIIFQSRNMAIMLLALAVICIVIVQLIFRSSMRKNGEAARTLTWQCNQTAMEAIHGSKEMLVMHKQEYFTHRYEILFEEKNKAAIKVSVGAASPSYIIEMICIVGLMLSVAIQLGNIKEPYTLLSQLSTVAVAAFRILPALGGISSGINSITANMPQLSAAYNTLLNVKNLEMQEVTKERISSQYKGIRFEKELQIKDLSFQYPEVENYVIADANFIIKKGRSVAFIGPSGAGKTTLSDIILALLKPSSGAVVMDGINIEDLGREWNEIIGYVPQMVYVIDDSIKRNVAFGVDEDEIDEKKVWEALKTAQLDEFVRNLPEGLYTKVGEFGVRFSGGQRQRLAIARALYRNPEILVLDEATAALDNETEKDVMKAIEALQGYKTLIIVAHRLTTVKQCDEIYEVNNGNVIPKDKKEIFDVN